MTKTIYHPGAVPLLRYPERFSIFTRLDAFTDMTTLVESLTSKSYLADIVHHRHPNLIEFSPSQYAKQCQPYIRLALQYIDQCITAPHDTSFLPAYYAMLQLIKVYIVLSSNNSLLPDNMWHGVSHKGAEKSSRTVLTECIYLREKGAIPLWYTTVTGTALRRTRRLSIADLLPFLPYAGAEYALVTGKDLRLARLVVAHPISNGSAVTIAAYTPGQGERLAKRELQVLRGRWRRGSGTANQFYGPRIRDASTHEEYLSRHLRRELIYLPTMTFQMTPISTGNIRLFEELPIVLLFFYLSSIARYRPDFLYRIRDSREWCILQAARRHCLFQFLVLFWSFVNQKTLLVDTPGPSLSQ